MTKGQMGGCRRGKRFKKESEEPSHKIKCEPRCVGRAGSSREQLPNTARAAAVAVFGSQAQNQYRCSSVALAAGPSQTGHQQNAGKGRRFFKCG